MSSSPSPRVVIFAGPNGARSISVIGTRRERWRAGGAGNFAQFASEAFLRTGKVKMVAFMDVDIKAASKMAGKFQAASYTVFEEFLSDDNIELVYISTPPSSHYHQSK